MQTNSILLVRYLIPSLLIIISRVSRYCRALTRRRTAFGDLSDASRTRERHRERSLSLSLTSGYEGKDGRGKKGRKGEEKGKKGRGREKRRRESPRGPSVRTR